MTDETLKVISRASTPAARWIAPQAASIIPSPIADSSITSSPLRSRTVAVGARWVPPPEARDSRTRRSSFPLPTSSMTIAARSWSVIWIFRSASSLKRANARFMWSGSIEMPTFSSASANAWRPECLPKTIWLPSRPISSGSMIS